MALTKEKKNAIVKDVTALLAESKMTVVAKYPGTTVKAMQQLRRDAAASGTTIHVIKNRLVIKALDQDSRWQAIDRTFLQGQVLYAFNPDDEVAPAQALATFAKLNPTLEFVGALAQDGKFLGSEDVKSLANLPTKLQLRGQLVGMFAAPLTGFMNVLSGNLRGVLNVLDARAKAINS